MTVQVDMSPATLHGTSDYRPWPEMAHSTRVLLRKAEESELGRAHLLKAAVVLMAFGVEGFCQTLGPELFGEAWLVKTGSAKRAIEREPILVRLKLIGGKVGVPVHYGQQPWKDLKALIRARDELAHPKPATREVIQKLQYQHGSDPRDCAAAAMRQKYMPLQDLQRLQTLLVTVREALLKLWQSSGRPDFDFDSFGMNSWSLSID